MPTSKLMPAALQICRRWIEKLRYDGRIVWLIDIEFKSPSHKKPVDEDTMQREVERIYELLLDNVQAGQEETLDYQRPILIGFPGNSAPTEILSPQFDSKPNKQRSIYHILLAEAQLYKEARAFDDYIEEHCEDFFGTAKNITAITVRLCRTTSEISSDETFDAFERAVVKTDSILILPKTEPLAKATAKSISRGREKLIRQLRDGFRRLIDTAKDARLAEADIFELYATKTDRLPFLTIFPECEFDEGGLEGINGTIYMRTHLTMKSATLVIPSAGVAKTLTGPTQRVFHDLIGVFEELLERDWEFQETPEFAAIIQSLAPLLDDSYDLRRTPSPLVYWASPIPDRRCWDSNDDEEEKEETA